MPTEETAMTLQDSPPSQEQVDDEHAPPPPPASHAPTPLLVSDSPTSTPTMSGTVSLRGIGDTKHAVFHSTELA